MKLVLHQTSSLIGLSFPSFPFGSLSLSIQISRSALGMIEEIWDQETRTDNEAAHHWSAAAVTNLVVRSSMYLSWKGDVVNEKRNDDESLVRHRL